MSSWQVVVDNNIRRIRDFAQAFPEIKEEGQPLLDFIKAFQPGREKEEHEDGREEEPEQTKNFFDSKLSGNFA
ncbi:MAG: hypothetical protein QTN59_01925 [Candidatus Electrothrix communis]|nr:MAG: hypothetical protein QTN59_01925 [Candidatus Electrothrix communis]